MPRILLVLAVLFATACNIERRTGGTGPGTHVTQVKVVPDSVTLDPMGQWQFQAYGRTNVGDSVPVDVQWTATSGTITPSGLFTADSSEDDVSITAEAEQLSGSALVRKRKVVKVLLSPDAATLLAGATQQFTARGVRSGGDTIPLSVSYTATGGTISSNGVYTAGAVAGGYRVVGIRRQLADTAAVTILNAPAVPVASVTVTPAAPSLRVGNTAQLNAVTKDSAGNILPGRSVAWTSNAPGVASVSTNGLVTAVSVGSATITASSEGKNGTAAVTVSVVSVASVTLTPGSAGLRVGGSLQLNATARDSAGNILNGRPVTWSSGAPGVASVSGSGMVNAVSAGSATITATSEGQSGTSAITVTVVPVASVTVSPSSMSVVVGGTAQLAATLKDSAGNVLTGRGISWSSGAPGVATVSAAGLVSGVSAGSATITALSEGKSGSATVGVTAPPPPGTRAGYYVATNGSSGGDGSAGKPWDLASALAGAGGRIQPGDTIWLRGGTYRGSYTSTLRGTAAAPIVVRQYPGERVTIDVDGATTSGLYVTGTYGVYWGFEIMNTNPDRTTLTPQRAHGVVNNGSHNKYVNLVVHDNGIAFYNYSSAADLEIYGCVVYNNGWQGPVKGGGHALYIKSDVGPVYLRDNILFTQFAYGVHVYTDAGSGQLNNVHVEGNVSFNNGTISAAGPSAVGANMLMGGEEPVQNSSLVGNMTYFSPGYGQYNVDLGFGSTFNDNLLVQGNYVVGGQRLFTVSYWRALTITGNTLIGPYLMAKLNDVNTSGQTWSGDTYHRDPNAMGWHYAGRDYSLSGWKTATGLGSTDQAVSAPPAATRVFVRPNVYEPGRATVVVYNWGGLSAVSVDLTGILPVGARYEVRNAQAIFGAPVASGTFGGGALNVPLGGVTPPVPVGGSATTPRKTGPAFDVFIVTTVGG